MGRQSVAIALAAALLTACSSKSAVPTAISAPSTTSPSSTGAPGPSTTTAPATSGAQWTTYFHDAGRSGETAEGPPSAASVRRDWTSPGLDGDVYAQPLIVGDRVVVATENDTVYALDASSGAIVWTTHLGEPVRSSSLPCGNVDPVGITGTPVVDAAAGRIYAVGMVKPGKHELFALDLSNGKSIASAVVDAPGAAPSTHNQRGALTLSGGRVLVPFGGRYGDCGTYHGQLVAVPIVAGTGLGKPVAFTLPTGNEGGFWAPPGPVVGDDGSVYLTSGNSAGSRTYDYGNSVVRISADLKLADSFAPSNWAALNESDTDLGSLSPVLLPNGRVFQAGKSGAGYLLDAAHLGGVGGQRYTATACRGAAFGGAAHSGTTVFLPCTSGVVALNVDADRFGIAWTAAVASAGPTITTPGAVWTVATDAGDLIAFDAGSGRQVFSGHVGSVPSRFTSPAAGAGRIVVVADRKVLAFR